MSVMLVALATLALFALGAAQSGTYAQVAYGVPTTYVQSPYVQPYYVQPYVTPGQYAPPSDVVYMPHTYFDVPAAQSMHTQAQATSHARIVDRPFAEVCRKYAARGWWGRFISQAPQDVGKLNMYRDVGDVVFAMDGASLAKMCDLTHMDDVLLGIGYPASAIADMKMSTPDGQPMTLVVWDSDEHGLDRATWRNLLKSADKQLDDGLLKAGRSRGRSLPKMYSPKWEKALNARTSPKRIFKFGEPQWRRGADGKTQRVVPVNDEAMNLDIAIANGFAVDDEEKLIAQMRSFLFNELSCNPEFKGDGFTWNHDDDSGAWGSSKGAEFLASNFDVLAEGKHHHEVAVKLPWKDAFKAGCEEAASRGWWGRFVAASAKDLHKLDQHKDVGDIVFAMDSSSLAMMCGVTYMDEILQVMSVPANLKADMKTRAPGQQPMTLVVWDDEEHYLDQATWRNVLISADAQLDARLALEGRLRESYAFPTFSKPKYEKDLDERTSPKRLFKFGEAQYRTHRGELGRVMPVNAQLMNLDIAMLHGFDVNDPIRLLAQMRSFLYNEVGCHADFKGDGFAWHYDGKADAWVSPKHAEYLAPIFDVKHAEIDGHEIHHREIPVRLPWRGADS